MSSAADEHRTIAAGFTDRVRGARPEAWDNPAPCEGWTARDVVRHLVEWFPDFLKAGAGVERGLRRPSAEVLQQLAKALRISAETLYVRAGILDPNDAQVRSVELAILADPGLTERQKQSLLDVYQSFRAANGTPVEPVPGSAEPITPGVDSDDAGDNRR